MTRVKVRITSGIGAGEQRAMELELRHAGQYEVAFSPERPLFDFLSEHGRVNDIQFEIEWEGNRLGGCSLAELGRRSRFRFTERLPPR